MESSAAVEITEPKIFLRGGQFEAQRDGIIQTIDLDNRQSGRIEQTHIPFAARVQAPKRNEQAEEHCQRADEYNCIQCFHNVTLPETC